MYKVKMMTSRENGYVDMGQFPTAEPAAELAKCLRVYYKPIDVYYTYAG